MDRPTQKLWWARDGGQALIVRAPDAMAAARVLRSADCYQNMTEEDLRSLAAEIEEIPADGPDEVVYEFW